MLEIGPKHLHKKVHQFFFRLEVSRLVEFLHWWCYSCSSQTGTVLFQSIHLVQHILYRTSHMKHVVPRSCLSGSRSYSHNMSLHKPAQYPLSGGFFFYSCWHQKIELIQQSFTCDEIVPVVNRQLKAVSSTSGNELWCFLRKGHYVFWGCLSPIPAVVFLLPNQLDVPFGVFLYLTLLPLSDNRQNVSVKYTTRTHNTEVTIMNWCTVFYIYTA